jgi:hypothetical protein
VSVPCPTCPWRRSSTVGGADIPNFDLEKMRGLANTVPSADDPGDGFRTIMACHGSACGAETACAGYVHVEGYTNLNVRMLALHGKIDIRAIDAACADLDLYDSFDEMLADYEKANV